MPKVTWLTAVDVNAVRVCEVFKFVQVGDEFRFVICDEDLVQHIDLVATHELSLVCSAGQIAVSKNSWHVLCDFSMTLQNAGVLAHRVTSGTITRLSELLPAKCFRESN